jgi:orotidine-5'-phosphate decarboxylase
MADAFGVRLQERVNDMGPLCVGIDPSREVTASWGRDDTAEGIEYVALSLIEAASGSAAAVKPQVAYFERFGSAGYAVLERVLREATAAGLLTIADAKRGDIGSTNEGYAQAWLDDASPLASDALTISPYTGVGALGSFFARVPTGKGIFVLAATSNDEGRTLQTARTADDEAVEDMVLREIATINLSADGLGGAGVVLGATRNPPRFDLARLHGPFLVPGVGAQGATPDQVGRLFARCAKGSVIVNVSRAISAVGPETSALRDSVRRWRDDLAAAL